MKRLPIAAMTLALLSAAPAAAAAPPRERQAYAREATGILPSLVPFARLRPAERMVRLRVRTAADATVRVELQTFCLNRSAVVRRKRRVAEGVGTFTARLAVPRARGFTCSVSASVRTKSRPAPASGAPGPIRLAVALYARR